jgi:hypothetical protein
MKLVDFIAVIRSMLDDEAEPQLWSDEELTRYLNNAVREACIRARLLRVDAVGDPATCVIAIDPVDGGRVAFDSSILVPRSGSIVGAPHKLWALASYDMDRVQPGWDEARDEAGTPRVMVMDLAQKSIQLWPKPDRAMTLHLRAWRVPRGDELLVNDADEPVIKIPDIEELRHWVAHEAYLKKDADANAEDASGTHLSLFEQRFGTRPSLMAMARWADSPPRVRHVQTF